MPICPPTFVASRRRLLRAAAVATAGLTGLTLARAQSRPRIATLTTGFAAGGSADVTARILADNLRGRYADTVIVDNRVGAGGRIAVEHVKNGPADGSNLLVSPSGMMVLFPHIYKSLRYDPLVDFTPVTPLAKFPFALALSSLVPAEISTLPQFIAWCKANPGQSSFGSPGAGTSAHFSGILLARRAGFNYTHVPYRGMAPLVQDLLGGQIASGVLTPADALPLIPSGKLRLVATTGTTRSKFMPEVPTYTEIGYPDVVIEESYSVYAPVAMPQAGVDELAALARQAVAQPEVQSRFSQMGLEAFSQSPAQFKASLRALHARWGEIVRTSGFTPTD